MFSESLYSVRMRASRENRHVSGAERIVSHGRIESVVAGLVARSMGKECRPDKTIITIETLNGMYIKSLTALDLVTLRVRNPEEGRAYALRVLNAAGVSETAARNAISFISNGAAPSGSIMRGAMIMDAETGGRLEPDRERGVRASRFDWSEDVLDQTTMMLSKIGLTHFRTIEALALASKVAHGPGIIAELCWSDDPDYTAGYAASVGIGYVRFPYLKNAGDDKGGRVFFINSDTAKNPGPLIRYLEEEAVLIIATAACRPEMDPDKFLIRLKEENSVHV